jgi:hypothetical protein
VVSVSFKERGKESWDRTEGHGGDEDPTYIQKISKNAYPFGSRIDMDIDFGVVYIHKESARLMAFKFSCA